MEEDGVEVVGLEECLGSYRVAPESLDSCKSQEVDYNLSWLTHEKRPADDHLASSSMALLRRCLGRQAAHRDTPFAARGGPAWAGLYVSVTPGRAAELTIDDSVQLLSDLVKLLCRTSILDGGVRSRRKGLHVAGHSSHHRFDQLECAQVGKMRQEACQPSDGCQWRGKTMEKAARKTKHVHARRTAQAPGEVEGCESASESGWSKGV